MARRIGCAPSWGKDRSGEFRHTAGVAGPVSGGPLRGCDTGARCPAGRPRNGSGVRPEFVASVPGEEDGSGLATRSRRGHSRKGPSWPDRRSGLAAAQALARARRFCSFFFRAARMRAVLFRRLGARFLAGMVASYPFLGGFRWSRRPPLGQLDRNATDPAGRRFAATPALAPAITGPRTRSPLMGAWRAPSGLPSSQTGKGMSISPRAAFRLSSRPRPPGDSPGGRSVEAGRGRPVSPSTWIRT
jgi:hypothetical protein